MGALPEPAVRPHCRLDRARHDRRSRTLSGCWHERPSRQTFWPCRAALRPRPLDPRRRTCLGKGRVARNWRGLHVPVLRVLPKSAKGAFVPRNKVGNSRGLDVPVLRVLLSTSAIIEKRIFLNGRRTGNIFRAAGASIRPITRGCGGCSRPNFNPWPRPPESVADAQTPPNFRMADQPETIAPFT